MGLVTFGIPEKDAEWLRQAMNLEVAVESGTYEGETALQLSKSFSVVYTIEKSVAMFEIAKRKIDGAENILQLKGDTRNHLASIVAANDYILFWLDAHWSGGPTYGQRDECPLIDELRMIFSAGIKNFAILVDDARLFCAPPPLPHNHKAWPSLKEICTVVPDEFDLIIRNDVIYIVPIAVKMRDYIQELTTSDWLQHIGSVRPSAKALGRLFLNKIFKHIRFAK